MNSVTPVVIELPDGKSYELRATLGARKRIAEIFGMGFQPALAKLDAGALPGILFALMHEANGKPPEGVTVSWLEEILPAESAPEMMAAIVSAFSQGRTPKNELEVLIKQAMATRNGSVSLPTAVRPSESPDLSSGGDTSKPN